MFTGLIEEAGTIRSLSRRSGSISYVLHAPKTSHGLRVDHSIAVNGVCLTVVRRVRSGFVVQAVEDTLKKTTLGRLTQGDRVNLERPLLPTSRLGGHFVLGHVDAQGEVVEKKTLGSSWIFRIKVPRRFAYQLIPVGSIAVDGISLTIAEVRGRMFSVSIIPHTMDVTIVDTWKRGSKVNLEFDVLGKYAEKFLRRRKGRR